MINVKKKNTVVSTLEAIMPENWNLLKNFLFVSYSLGRAFVQKTPIYESINKTLSYYKIRESKVA